MMAACGTTTASFSVFTVCEISTKAPGHSLRSRLSNTALTLTDPELASTVLSTNFSRPLKLPAPSGSAACTTAPPSPSAARASGRLRCGRLKATAIGSSWVMVTSVLKLACTALPADTLTAPARPATGAVMRA